MSGKAYGISNLAGTSPARPEVRETQWYTEDLGQPDELVWSIRRGIVRWPVICSLQIAGAIGVGFDDGADKTGSFDLEAYELLMLQLLEVAIGYAGLRSTTHTRIDAAPLAEPFAQCVLFAAVLRNVQDRVDDMKIAERDVAAL